jgi:PAS domain S-box-containing protein
MKTSDNSSAVGSTNEVLNDKIRNLEKKVRFLELFNEQSNVWEIYRDQNGLIFYMSPSFEIITGYKREDFMNDTSRLFNIVHPDDLAAARERLSRKNIGKTFHAIEVRILHKNGEIRHISVSSMPVYQDDGTFIGTHTSAIDITTTKLFELELNNKLEEVNRLNKDLEHYAFVNNDLKQFAYISSHQLQEPIRTVRNYIQIIEEDYAQLLDENARKYMGIVRNATERMSYLINTLLEFSRIGRISTISSSDCGRIVNEVLSDMNFQIGESGAVVEVGAMPKLNIYETEFRQLIRNLVGNAIKFRRKGTSPEISITAVRMNAGYRFSVKDNGIGIDPVHAERIFEIFQRLHLNEEEYEGKGVGLAYCRKIVNMHGGEIWVESSPGAGSIFYFTIPIT